MCKCCIILIFRELCQQDVQIEIIFKKLYFLKRNALLVGIEIIIHFDLLYLFNFCCKQKAKRNLGKLMASSHFLQECTWFYQLQNCTVGYEQLRVNTRTYKDLCSSYVCVDISTGYASHT